ncbi:MAG TPA: cupin domain-containing protein [Gammaproteobacteria bacterium]|nr:cupin domain-containing protein [Gammaproteobacteria bacterium]
MIKGSIRLFFLLSISLFLTMTYAANHNPENTFSKVLLQSDHSWDGTKYPAYPTSQPEITVVKIHIPAHTALPWHTHPIINAAYVLSGTLYVETKDGSLHRTLKSGDVLAEMVNKVHRGYTTDQPVDLIVFYAGTPGTPTAVVAK